MSASAQPIHLITRPGALAWRAIRQNPVRAGLSALAVSFGVAMTIASNMIAGAVREGILKTEELRIMMAGLLSQLDPILSFVSVVIVAAAGFLVFNAFSMAITQRQREIGIQRALGMTRRQVLAQLLQEGLLIGGAGTILGVLAGPPLGWVIVSLLRRFGEGLFAYEDVPPTLFSVLLAIGLGLGASLLVTLLPARRAMRIPPLAALRQATLGALEPVRPWTAWLGLGVLAILLGYLIIAPPGEWAYAPLDTRAAIVCCALWLGGLWLLLRAAPDVVGRLLHRPLIRVFGAAGRLMADNLQRDRNRVTLTILTIAFGLLVLAGINGFLKFFVSSIFLQTLQPGIERDMVFVSRPDIARGWESTINQHLDSVLVSEEESAGIRGEVGDRGEVIAVHFLTVPELSLLGDVYFSYLLDPAILPAFGDSMFTFIQGDWDSARPLLASGCGVLVSPLVAIKNGAGLGDTITVQGIHGPVDCVVAGIGSSVVNASIISAAAAAEFPPSRPVMEIVLPHLGVDGAALEADLIDLTAEYPLLHITTMQVMADAVDGVDIFYTSLNGLLLLALLAAALGVVNTMLMSVTERRPELGLLRAVGATRRQARTLLLGEAALMGLVGAVFGGLAGLGCVVIFVVAYGGHSWGVSFPLWPTALEVAGVALPGAILGLIAAPLIAAGAAWFPARQVLRQDTLDMLTPEHLG